MTIKNTIHFCVDEVDDYESFKQNLIKKGYILKETTLGCTATITTRFIFDNKIATSSCEM